MWLEIHPEHLIQARFGGAECSKSGNVRQQCGLGWNTNPSSDPRKAVADPDSLDMNAILPMGIRV